jgi:hypothetical protein
MKVVTHVAEERRNRGRDHDRRLRDATQKHPDRKWKSLHKRLPEHDQVTISAGN